MRQAELDIKAESFTEREKFLKKRLRQHYTIDREIRKADEKSRGIGLKHDPSLTAAPPRDDDPIVRRILQMDMLPEGARKVVHSVQNYTGDEEFVYAASYRVIRELERIEPIAREHEEHIQMVLKLLKENHQEEEYVHMTDVERLAVLREAEIETAREQLPILRRRKRIVDDALSDLENYYPEWYIILYNKYVLRKNWMQVCVLAARDGKPLTEDQYLYSRKQAFQQFDKWAVGLL